VVAAAFERFNSPGVEYTVVTLTGEDAFGV